ncbi:MAG: sulfotransferase [Chloroflexi bacterium]|nr:sulfotransferase [Chloroflexota bacterium]
MKDYRLLFVSGASGSGTTLMAEILTASENVMAVAGKHRTLSRAQDEDAFRLAKRVNRTTRELWDRQADVQTYMAAKNRLPGMIDELLQFKQHAGTTHVMIKRSAPFDKGDRYRPDMMDMLELFPNLRILIIYRDPRAATYSCQRRGFALNLRNMAIICEEQLTYLSAQLETIDPALYKVVQYEKWMQQGVTITEEIAEFAGIPKQALVEAVKGNRLDGGKNNQWRAGLTDEDAHFLDEFFSAQRRRRWAFLEKACE